MRHIPNLITLANLLCGCLALEAIFHSDLFTAGILVLIALVLDFMDGFTARMLKAYSEIGKQLDSLADMVTFGVVPGMMLYSIFRHENAHVLTPFWLMAGQYFMLIVTLFSALRLARFNIDTRQSESFIGVPTPANTLMVISFGFILAHDEFGLTRIIGNPFFLTAFALISSWLMVAEIPLISLKFKTFGITENKARYILLLTSLVCILLLRYAAPPVIIIFYVLLSLIFPPKTTTT
ncbi:MAG: CDP-diacylglycerol--serine O-phosphatidyltransferase [Bacteroidia bacterium]